MSSHGKSSSSSQDKKNIAKQFDLPERQSKIASILKQPEVYCICRSTDSTSFMIACDNCEEWYHGDCIGINEAQSKHIKRYFCDQCRLENKFLRIEYKKQKGAAAVKEKHQPPPKEKTIPPQTKEKASSNQKEKHSQSEAP